jgi:hypothetical protein
MLVVSGGYQDYQNGAVSNQLTGGRSVLGVTEGVHCTLYTPQSNNVSTRICHPLK